MLIAIDELSTDSEIPSGVEMEWLYLNAERSVVVVVAVVAAVLDVARLSSGRTHTISKCLEDVCERRCSSGRSYLLPEVRPGGVIAAATTAIYVLALSS